MSSWAGDGHLDSPRIQGPLKAPRETKKRKTITGVSVGSLHRKDGKQVHNQFLEGRGLRTSKHGGKKNDEEREIWRRKKGLDFHFRWLKREPSLKVQKKGRRLKGAKNDRDLVRNGERGISQCEKIMTGK